MLRLLERRFGPVPAHLVEQVRATPSQQMPELLDVILDAAALDQVAAALEAMLPSARA